VLRGLKSAAALAGVNLANTSSSSFAAFTRSPGTRRCVAFVLRQCCAKFAPCWAALNKCLGSMIRGSVCFRWKMKKMEAEKPIDKYEN